MTSPNSSDVSICLSNDPRYDAFDDDDDANEASIMNMDIDEIISIANNTYLCFLTLHIYINILPQGPNHHHKNHRFNGFLVFLRKKKNYSSKT